MESLPAPPVSCGRAERAARTVATKDGRACGVSGRCIVPRRRPRGEATFARPAPPGAALARPVRFVGRDILASKSLGSSSAISSISRSALASLPSLAAELRFSPVELAVSDEGCSGSVGCCSGSVGCSLRGASANPATIRTERSIWPGATVDASSIRAITRAMVSAASSAWLSERPHRSNARAAASRSVSSHSIGSKLARETRAGDRAIASSKA